MCNAAMNGHLDVLQYLHEHGMDGWSSEAMDQAARNGHR